MSRINIIVATSKNLVIGKDNDLPWRLPTDLKHFKKITEGHWVVMGRKCWLSIPEKFRPLPNRENIVVSRDKEFNAIGASQINDLETLLVSFKNTSKNKDVFIIGGAQIYKQSFDYADTLYLTEIDDEVDGDTFLEGFNKDEWVLESVSDYIEENGFKFRFNKYQKKLVKS